MTPTERALLATTARDLRQQLRRRYRSRRDTYVPIERWRKLMYLLRQMAAKYQQPSQQPQQPQA